jgi:hypothetical protein
MPALERQWLMDRPVRPDPMTTGSCPSLPAGCDMGGILAEFRRGQCKARIGGLTDHLVLVLLVPLQSSHLRHIPRRESWKPS